MKRKVNKVKDKKILNSEESFSLLVMLFLVANIILFIMRGGIDELVVVLPILVLALGVLINYKYCYKKLNLTNKQKVSIVIIDVIILIIYLVVMNKYNIGLIPSFESSKIVPVLGYYISSAMFVSFCNNMLIAFIVILDILLAGFVFQIINRKHKK